MTEHDGLDDSDDEHLVTCHRPVEECVRCTLIVEWAAAWRRRLLLLEVLAQGE